MNKCRWTWRIIDKLDRYDYFKDEFVIQINELWWTWRIVGELDVHILYDYFEVE